ncbi:MAG: sigma-70 family RNA polymerase sigma factor [Planctomycetes bacterium]|nr:sigma-70 family RNA polymerase sigma factor [Planctomycetota bacterium]
MEDEKLVELSLKGERNAFDELVRKYSKLVASVAFSKIGKMQEIEDILQETFMRAWTNLKTLRDMSKFSSWLYGITYWVCREKINQKSKGFVSLDGEDSTFSPPVPETKDEQNLNQQIILNAMGKLPGIYREVIILNYFEKQSYEEMSKQLGITKAGINFRLTKGRSLLKKYVKEGQANNGGKL